MWVHWFYGHNADMDTERVEEEENPDDEQSTSIITSTV